LYFGNYLCERFRIASRDHKLSALVRQPKRDGPSDSAAAARHNDDLTREASG
jgi:hypothetical protein